MSINIQECKNLDQLNQFVRHLSVQNIGFLGGRRFEKEKTSCTMNSIVSQLNNVSETVDFSIKDDSDRFKEIVSTIIKLDNEANSKLSRKNCVTLQITIDPRL